MLLGSVNQVFSLSYQIELVFILFPPLLRSNSKVRDKITFGHTFTMGQMYFCFKVEISRTDMNYLDLQKWWFVQLIRICTLYKTKLSGNCCGNHKKWKRKSIEAWDTHISYRTHNFDWKTLIFNAWLHTVNCWFF